MCPAMRIIKLAWVGTRSDNAEPTVAFFRDVLGLRLELDRPGFWMLKLDDGSKVEVFGPDSEINRHFTTGPVAGFLVDDVQAATAALRAAGVEILFESGLDDSGNAWVHFRAPDGNIYEFTQDPGVARPHWRGPEPNRLGSTPAVVTMPGWGADRHRAGAGR
jgi:catechol 2,3-dioxygenase-like lactoylglutathione lyase family enzyme